MRNERARALAASRAFAAIVLLVAFIAAAVGLAGLSGCTAADSQQEGDTLRVGVRSDIVNFGYLNERTGKYYGLEIDIAEEMARRMGYADVEFVTVTPDTRKDMLMNGEVDCLAACYSISDTRLENFDFSPAYYTDDAVIMVENSYKGKLVKGRGEELRTTKIDTANHGIGLSSVRRAVGKYHGTVSIDDSIPECFVIRMVLYGE